MQLAIEARVHSQTLGNGQDNLPMSDRSADVFSHVDRGQQRPLLVTRGTGAALPAGEGDKDLMLAVGTTNPGEAFLQITALKKGRHGLLHDRPPISVLVLIALDLTYSTDAGYTAAASARAAADSVENLSVRPDRGKPDWSFQSRATMV